MRGASRIRLAVLSLAFVAAARAQDQLQRVVKTEDAGAVRVGEVLPDLRLRPVNGRPRTLGELCAGRRAVVLAMRSIGCPVSIRYGPRIAVAEDDFAARGVAFVYINCVDADTDDEIRREAQELGFNGVAVADRDGSLRRALRPSTTTEVIVVDADRRVRYRGAVDDQYRVGGAAAKPKRSYLREALAAVLTGKDPEFRATAAPGCLVDIPKGAGEPDAAPPTALTYAGRIRGVLATHCTPCHTVGGEAPFSLETPGAIEGRARMIEAVLRGGLMPPNHGLRRESGPAAQVRDRTLPEDDLRDLLAWLRSPREVGEVTVTPVASSGTWRIGRPDGVVFTTPQQLKGDGPLRHGRFLVPLQNPGDMWVRAVECRPAMPGSVHHALVWLLSPGEILPADEAVPSGRLLATYSPGEGLTEFVGGVPVRAGSVLVVDLYAERMDGDRHGTPQLRVAMRTTSERPAQEVELRVLAPDRLSIGAGESAGVIAERSLDRDATVVALTPCLRLRGTAVSVDAVAPDGAVTRLLDAASYDPRWRIRYEMPPGVRLAAGTVLRATARFDNTAENPSNPSAGAPVRDGLGADDEIMAVGAELLP